MYRTFFRKVLWLGALLLLLLPVGVMAEPLDEIEEEIIYLKTREDGSLDIQYHIEWKVLDSTSEGKDRNSQCLCGRYESFERQH